MTPHVSNKTPERIVIIWFSVAFAIAFLALVLSGCGIKYEGETTGCTVTDKYISVSGNGEGTSSTKRVSTTCGEFKVEDELSQGNWNSADVYGQIEVGKTYDFEAYGFRNGFLSSFPNINSATEVR